MKKVLELPDEIANALEREASRTGTSAANWIADQLKLSNTAETNLSPDENQPTLGERFGHLFGLFSSSAESVSQQGRDQFVDYLEEKRKIGRL